MKDIMHEQLNIQGRGFFSRIYLSQQRQLSDAFAEFMQGDNGGTILDVSLAPSSLHQEAWYLVAWADPQLRARMTAHRIQLSSESLDLPFVGGEFDWACCNGVIEHAGDSTRQAQLVRELARVTRKGVFVATPNRRHPVDFTTAMPLAHWLPDVWRQRILNWAGKNGQALQPRPNLLRAESLYRYAEMLPEKLKHDVGHKRVFGIKSHFFLIITKDRPIAWN